MKVPRLGDRAFELCAGFLRIRDGDEPLDASAVHPEAYPLARRIVAACGRDVRTLARDGSVLKSLRPADFVDERFGLPTVRDILAELEKPARDPRPAFRTASFAQGVERIDDLKPGMVLEGTVSNVAAFGAFVDVGVHEDGLVHVSQLADRFVKDPGEVVKAGDVVEVRVLEVDLKRKRISLSMRKHDAPAKARPERKAPPRARRKARRSRRPRPRARWRPRCRRRWPASGERTWRMLCRTAWATIGHSATAARPPCHPSTSSLAPSFPRSTTPFRVPCARSATRYDFKGSNCSIERADTVLTIKADDDFKLKQVQELLRGHLARRKVDAGAFDFAKPEKAAGNSLRQTVTIKQGVDRDLAQQVVKAIKGAKLKVQVAIQGDELRVSGKKRDDLQEAIALVKGLEIEQPLQYVNFRD